MPTLERLDGEQVSHKLKLGPGRVVVGRADNADFWLGGNEVSRRHAVLEPREDGWWLVDRSRHGTLVNGSPVERVRLEHDDRISIGSNHLRFVSREAARSPTTTRLVRPIVHEEPVAYDEGSVAVARAELSFTRGRRAGERVMLDGARHLLGGGDKDDLYLEGLPAGAVELNVVRGRVMIAPRAFPTLVGGRTAPATMPVFEGEEVELDEHAFIVRTTFSEVAEARSSFGQLVGSSDTMRTLFGALARIAAHDHPVLLVGESGTGKELAAKALHDEGTRASMPFVPVNCAALPDALVESTLFGHVRGAFTGAVSDQDGAFQRANGGTLFLDEVGELKLEAQAKLLRALESREVRRVGAKQAEFPDVRVIAATNRDLGAMVGEGSFRGDLYFRLSVLSVRMPSLREHVQDVPEIARALVKRHMPDAKLPADTLERLQEHAWPGNVRELRNVLTRAYVLGGPHIVPSALSFSSLPSSPDWVANDANSHERTRILDALGKARGNKAGAARILGIPRSSLLYRMKKLGL